MSTPQHNALFGFEIDAHRHDGNGKQRLDWIEDSFLIDRPHGRHTPLPESGRFLGSSFSMLKARWFLFAVGVVFVLIIGRIGYLQIVNHGAYSRIAERNRERIIPIPAERGLIFDRNGLPLTKNIPNFSLALVPQDLPRDQHAREQIVSQIAEITQKPTDDIRSLINEYGSYRYESVVIQEHLDYDTALRLQIAAADLPGLFIQRGSKRLYLYPDTATGTPRELTTSTPFSLAHVIGYQGKLNPDELETLTDSDYIPSDFIGKTGVEKTYETALRGSYGHERVEVDARGRHQSVITHEPPSPGDHIRLAVDARMQMMLESIILDEMKREGKQRGAGVVLDPRNGDVLALVSLPAFDNNDFSGGISRQTYARYQEDQDTPLFNRAIGGRYPSGSVIKPLMAAAGLQERVITPRTTFLSTGGIGVGQWFFPDWLPGGHGVTNLKSSLAWSINTFYYILGGGHNGREGLGIERMAQYLRLFGFGERLGIDLTGEAAGLVPTPEWKERVVEEQWYIGDTYNVSIGQGHLLVTPLQIAAMTAAIANNGTLYVPHVAAALIDPISKKETLIQPKVIRENIIDPVHLASVREGMVACVQGGSCARLANLPFLSGAKTGTAQWSNNRDTHAWFTAFAPLARPEVVVTVLMEEGGEGGYISSRAAYRFLEWWGRYK